MKNILLIFLFLLPFTLMAQKDALGPHKNDNVIVVTTDTVDKTALEKAISALIDQGFTIKEKNIEKGTIITNPYDYKKGNLIINVQVASNEIKIYGEYGTNLAVVSGANKPKQITMKVNYEGVKGGSAKEAWSVMDAFANQLAQILKASVSYLKW